MRTAAMSRVIEFDSGGY